MKKIVLAAVMAFALSPAAAVAGVLAYTTTADATAQVGGGRLLGLHVRTGASDGTVVITRGQDLTEEVTFYTQANTAEYIPIPEPGFDMPNNIYIDITNVDGVTLFYK